MSWIRRSARHSPRGSNPRSAVSQREVIDEYGWRNWGDMMADHETDGYVQSWDVPISHYNNQYTGIDDEEEPENSTMKLFLPMSPTP